MKCNPWRWLWGLIPLAMLGAVAVFFERDRIEADLNSRARAELEKAGLAWASSGFSGRDAAISGLATDDQDPQKAVAVLRNVWGVRVVDTNINLIDKADNYSWGATRTAGRIVLRGNVPNEAMRQVVLGVARANFPGIEITDRTTLARGVPTSDAWLAGVSFGLKQLAGLKQGEARLDGLALTVSGEADDAAGYRGIKSALAGNMPRGVRLADDRVLPPAVSPFLWGARFAGSQVMLTGHVPSDGAREELFAAAKAAFPRAAVVDRMETAGGAPQDWIRAASGALRELARLDDGNADMRDGQLSVTGMARDEATADAARKGLQESLPKSFRFAEQIKVRDTAPTTATPPPQVRTASPYVTSVDVDGAAVVLTGFAPNEALRSAFAQVASVRFPGRRIDNRLEIAAGFPTTWQRCTESGMAAVGRLGAGQLRISDRRLDVIGATDDEALVRAIPADLAGQTAGACETTARIVYQAPAEPDLDWRATFAGREIVLAGDVPSAAVKAELTQTATRLFRDVTVVDRMRVVDSRSRKWPAVASQGLLLLARLNRGEARLQRQQLTLTGEARDNLTVTQVRDQLAREISPGYTGRETIEVRTAAAVQTPPPPAATPATVAPTLPPDARAAAARACQDQLKTTARDGTIRFQRASAELAEESFATLDKLAVVAKTCPDLALEIEGHTDAEGTSERNQRLSDRRAQSVVGYLAKAGVDQGRLRGVGYGETRPIAPNDTPDNRARNRRIEFTVRAN